MIVGSAFANVAASQTDAALVPAKPGYRIRVLGFSTQAGGTATGITFNSKGSGSGTAISPLYANGINSPNNPDYNPNGLYETNVGEALTCNTGAGSTTGIQVSYAYRYSL